MVKRREQKNSEIPNVDPKRVEEFASRVDEGAKPGRMGRPPKAPGMKRDYKAISLPFNQAEWERRTIYSGNNRILFRCNQEE